jgi:hypothetical protein
MSNAANADWFYTVHGREHGPITSIELRELAASGRLSSSDFVRRADMTEAVPATRVKGLFPVQAGEPLGRAPQKSPEGPIHLPDTLVRPGDLPPPWSAGDGIEPPEMFASLPPAESQRYVPLLHSGKRSGGIAGFLFSDQSSLDEAYAATVDGMGKQFTVLVGLGDKARYTFIRTEHPAGINLPVMVSTDVAFTQGLAMVHIRMSGCLTEEPVGLACRIAKRLLPLA